MKGKKAKKNFPKLYKIGELIEYAGLSRQTIHNYTLIGLISPVRRTKSGHRLYSEESIRRLLKIKKMKAKGYTLEKIKNGVLEKRSK